MFELISLPVLQVLAAGLSLAVVVILDKPVFVLPFRNLEQVLASTPPGAIAGGGADPAPEPRGGAEHPVADARAGNRPAAGRLRGG